MAAEHLNSRIFSHTVVWLDGGSSQSARSGDHKICSVHKTVTSPDLEILEFRIFDHNTNLQRRLDLQFKFHFVLSYLLQK